MRCKNPSFKTCSFLAVTAVLCSFVQPPYQPGRLPSEVEEFIQMQRGLHESTGAYASGRGRQSNVEDEDASEARDRLL